MVRWLKSAFAFELFLLSVLSLISMGLGSLKVLAQEWKSGGVHQHPVKPVAPGILYVSLPEVRDLVDRGGALILDARSPALFEKGHVPLAKNLFVLDLNIQFRKLETEIRHAAARGLPIVVYCTDRNCPDSMRVAEFLLERGIRPLKIYSGGWREWSEQMSGTLAP